ncbi:hypothetical protein JCM30795_15900 [Agathobaculum butyriciproducens]
MMHRDFSWSYEREIETGKQCKAVPTLRKQADSVHTESACFMLVGALPQSPQNTKLCSETTDKSIGYAIL